MTRFFPRFFPGILSSSSDVSFHIVYGSKRIMELWMPEDFWLKSDVAGVLLKLWSSINDAQWEKSSSEFNSQLSHQLEEIEYFRSSANEMLSSRDHRKYSSLPKTFFVGVLAASESE